MEINIYLVLSPVEKIIPRLLEKVYEAGERCLFHVPSEEEAEEWNKLLWTYTQKSFLPHGTTKDVYPERHPIWISSKMQNINNSSVFLTMEALKDIPATHFTKIIYVLCIHTQDGITLAQQHIKEYTNKKLNLKIWRQTPDSKWQNIEPSQVDLI